MNTRERRMRCEFTQEEEEMYPVQVELLQKSRNILSKGLYKLDDDCKTRRVWSKEQKKEVIGMGVLWLVIVLVLAIPVFIALYE